jgi:putative ABC transport system permease protein
MNHSAEEGSPWRLELSRDAAREVREAPPVLRTHLAGLLDELTEAGLPENAELLGDGSYSIHHGETEAVVTVSAEERCIVVARLTATDRPPARDALRAAHVPPVLSSRLARFADELTTDVRTSLRSFRRSPGFVLSVLATLTIAIGGTTTLFGLASTVFSGAMPFEDDGELLRLRDRMESANGDPRIANMAPLGFASIRDQANTLDGVAAATGVDLVLTGGEISQRVNVIRVSEGWVDLLGVRPTLGRLFSPEEERLGADAQVALISHSLWESRFGSDPGMVGSSIEYDGGLFTVVGVLQPRFRYPYDADLWTPWRWDPTDGTSHDLNVVGRMSDGVTTEAVVQDLDRISLGLQQTRPDTNEGLFLNVETLRSDFIRDEGSVLLALLAAVGFLLLLACVNVTNLFVARFVARQREVGIRVALGAGRIREIRGFMVETVLLFLGGGTLGLGVSLWLGGAMSNLVPDVMRSQLSMAGLQLDAKLLLFSIGLSAVAGAAFGLIAAVKGTRTDLSQVLKEGGRGGSASGSGLQRVLVITQLALSLSLLVGAGVLFDHFQRLSAADLGMDVEGLYSMRVSVEQERFSQEGTRLDIVERLQNAISSVPGVESAAYTTVNPLCCGDWGAPLGVEGLIQPEGSLHLIHHRLVGPGYFAAMGTPLLQGRDFDGSDVPGSPGTVIVDEALADRFWPDEQAVGKRVRMDRPGTEWLTVVGVVGDVEEDGDYSETWYLPYTLTPTARSTESIHFMIRADDAGVLDDARRAVREVDANLAAYELRTMASLRAENISQDRLGAAVGSVFGAFGLLLAGLGVFGMLSYNVSTRSREIGTRIALGAHPSEVTGLVLKGAMKLTVVGGVFGIALAIGLNGVLQRVIFGVEAASPSLIVALSLALLVASGIAAALPALHASRVDPIEALKD